MSVGANPDVAVNQTVPLHNLDRPLSPPPEGTPQAQPQQPLQPNHSLLPNAGEPLREDSSGGSGSDRGF